MIGEIPTWADAVSVFIQRCQGNGLSKSTVDGYRWTLTRGRLPAFRTRHGVMGPAELSADMLEALKLELLGAGLAPTSVGDYCRVIRVFARFCIDRGWLESSGILNVKSPRTPKHAPRAFSEDEETQLLSACTCERDRVLVRFAIETGLRRAEIASLKVEDVVQGQSGWLIRVRNGKGGKDRGVPISEAFGRQLTRYIAKVRPHTTCRGMFLTLKRSDAGDYAPLTGDGLYRVFFHLSKATGIRAYPHRGRHTFATRAAQDGVAPWALQGSLGHASIDMTERYVNAAAVDLQAAFSQRRKEPEVDHVVLDIRERLEHRQITRDALLAEQQSPALDTTYSRALYAMTLALAAYVGLEGEEFAGLLERARTAGNINEGATATLAELRENLGEIT